MRRRALAAGAFLATAAAGAAMGWAAERRALRGTLPGDDPEWAELRRRRHGDPLAVESFDGTLLSADVLGPATAPTVVFAHGFGLAKHVWHYQRRDLPGRLRLVCYDQRGHGRSEPAASGDYGIAALGRDLAAVVEAAAPPEGAVVVGHSMGGMSLLSYVEQFPEAVGERLRAAVFVDTSGSDVVSGALVSSGLAAAKTLRSSAVNRVWRAVGRAPRLAERAWASSTDLSFLLTRALGLNADASPAQVAFVEQMILDAPTDVMAALGPLFTSLDLRDAARLVKVPALVVVGEHDRLTPPAQARKLADLLPDAELVEIPGAGHTSFLEAPEAVNAELQAFVRRVGR